MRSISASKIKKQQAKASDGFQNCTFRLKASNYAWARRQAIESGQSTASVLDTAIESIRNNKTFSLEKKIPAYIQKAEAAKQRKLARLNSFGGNTERINGASATATPIRAKRRQKTEAQSSAMAG